MAVHVGYNHTIAVANKERWHHAGGLWWKTLVDGREPVQDKADGCVHSVSISLDLRDQRRIRFGLSSRTKLNSEVHKKYENGD